LVVLVALGTLGYIALEGAHPFDAFYMVMITVSTVGFGDVFPLDRAGRLLTVVIMVMGVGLAFYTATAGIEQMFLLASERRRSRTMRSIASVSNHVILCGLGRVGRRTLRSLQARGIDVVVIEADESRVDHAIQEGVTAIAGDATHNETLEQAGIRRARALVACVTDDADNLVIVLSARSLVADLHIVSRASEEEWESKLRMAGADRVVAPQVVGSERLAAMAVERDLADIFDVVVGGRAIEFAVEEIELSSDSGMVGTSIRESGLRERTGALILAVEDLSRKSFTAPDPEHILVPGSVVIVVGTPQQVEAAARLLRP
jgi:voltage-gated potassium channel